MSNEIKAIETVYDGYRFRSRLEARCAVFFTSLGVRFEYEPEGFELSCGRYLPDFYLTDLDLYVEIKPFNKEVVSFPGDGNEWEQKCAAFRSETGKAIMLCYSDPSKDIWCQLFAFIFKDSGGGEYQASATLKELDGVFYVVADIADPVYEVCINNGTETNKQIITAYQWVVLNAKRLAYDEMRVMYDPSVPDALNIAKTKARQARFEFGERP